MLERNEPLTKKDMLEFIRAHREALNEKTVKASPQEEGQFLPEMQMWNAIEAQVREMTAVEFLEVLNEECAKHEGITDGKTNPCQRCPFDGNCIYGDNPDSHRAVEVVRKWKEEQDGSAQTRG